RDRRRQSPARGKACFGNRGAAPAGTRAAAHPALSVYGVALARLNGHGFGERTEPGDALVEAEKRARESGCIKAPPPILELALDRLVGGLLALQLGNRVFEHVAVGLKGLALALGPGGVGRGG